MTDGVIAAVFGSDLAYIAGILTSEGAIVRFGSATDLRLARIAPH